MKSVIIEKPPLSLVGFDFFGDPFRSHGGWSEENEIGRLWARWMAYLASAPPLQHVQAPDVMVELHVYHPETPQTGEFEVFTGVPVTEFGDLPPEVVAKRLPAGRYAVFTLIGEEIASDWPWLMDTEWLPPLGVQRLTTFTLQCYDARFKGMDHLAQSELEVHVPLKS